MARAVVLALAALGCAANALAAPAFKETFDDDAWETRWKKSTWKKDEGTDGSFTLATGKHFGDRAINQGIKTGPDARFFALYSTLSKPFDNKGKDLVFQFSVKHEQSIDCGGGYLKIIPDTVSEKDMEAFSGDTPYSIMFGPDICGYSTKKVHVILNYKGENHLISEHIAAETDTLTHVYTLAIHPDSTYEVFIDTASVQKGSLYDHWKMLQPRQIKDPDAKKPDDWDERRMIEDPEDKKPEGYDDVPKTIKDPEAKQPEDWDAAEDGEWEAPEIPNPEFKPWSPKMIENPDFKGIWSAPLIDNPDFQDDPDLYVFPPAKYIGFELWQVKAGSIFDNIMLTDSVEEALAFAKDTWGKTIDGEKKMKEAEDEEKRKEEEEMMKKSQEEAEMGGEVEQPDEKDEL